MKAGRLREEKITIYRLPVEMSEYGPYLNIKNLELICSTRASKSYTSMTRTEDNDALTFPVSITFYVRSYVPVAEDHIILWNDRYWRVLSVIPNKYYQDIEVATELITLYK